MWKWFATKLAPAHSVRPLLARADCEHALGCYVCPSDRCNMRLCAPVESDPNKSRQGPDSMCIFLPTRGGQVRQVRMMVAGANRHCAHLAELRGDPKPTASELPPGLKATDQLPELLTAIKAVES